MENTENGEVQAPQKSEREVELENLLAKADTEKTGLVEELKALRAKRDPAPAENVEQKVQEVLSKQRQDEAKVNLTKAIEQFRQENKEFHPDNDPGNLKWGLVDKEFKLINLQGLYSVDDFKSVLSKAKILATYKPNQADGEKITPDASTPIESSNPQSNASSKLSPQEQALIKQVGWTEEKYLGLKAKMPDYINSLLRDVRP